MREINVTSYVKGIVKVLRAKTLCSCLEAQKKYVFVIKILFLAFKTKIKTFVGFFRKMVVTYLISFVAFQQKFKIDIFENIVV